MASYFLDRTPSEHLMECCSSSMNIGLAFILIVVARLLFRILPLRCFRRISIEHIPGPSPSSWIYGNMRELMLPTEYGQYEYEWQAKYGLVYRIKGCFGEDRLMISDPHTVRHVLADTSKFKRSPQQQQIVRMLVGEWSVFHVAGDDHRRVRAVMNPAFSAANVRALPPLFHRIAIKMADQWQQSISQIDGAVINILPFLHRATLDVIGEAILGVPFNTLENGNSELARTHHNIVAMSSTRSKTSVLLDGVINYLPLAILRLALNLPTAALRHLRHNRKMTANIATELIEAKADAFQKGLETEKDLLSLLVNANATMNASKKMSVIEMRDQVAGIMVAGQETTATTISWALYELAKDVSAQARLREEISETYDAVYSRGDSELAYTDLEGMPYLNAYIKEILRVYAALPMSERVAAEDVVLPLAKPIMTTAGERITELPVRKGQLLIIATSAYHQATSIWGEDAKEFRPSRWIQGDGIKAASLGPYANLLTFLGGPRTCIGWRLAVTEIQVVVIELIRKFTFSIPDGTVVRKGLALTLIPVMGRGSGEQRLPLHVKVME